jgi:hypothetical protein
VVTSVSGSGGGGHLTTKGDLEAYTTEQTRLAIGSNDQVLTADSSASAGVAWKTAAGGGDITTDDEWDAKGDLIAGTGSDAADRVAVGSNDHVLLADSSASTGVAWNKSIPLTVVYRGDDTGDYTVAATDDVIIVDDEQAFDDITITLPAASSNSGRVLTFTGGDALMAGLYLDGNGAETINGSSTLEVPTSSTVTIVCDGSNWWIISNYGGI